MFVLYIVSVRCLQHAQHMFSQNYLHNPRFIFIFYKSSWPFPPPHFLVSCNKQLTSNLCVCIIRWPHRWLRPFADVSPPKKQVRPCPTTTTGSAATEQSSFHRSKTESLRPHLNPNVLLSSSEWSFHHVNHSPETIFQSQSSGAGAGLDEPRPAVTRSPQAQFQAECFWAQSTWQVLFVGHNDKRNSSETVVSQDLRNILN